MSRNDAYLAKMEAQLKEWSARIDGLAASAEKATAEGRLELRKQLEAAHVKYKEIVHRFEELRAASENSFATLKAGFEAALRELTTSFNKRRP